jgi:hypothetical protein
MWNNAEMLKPAGLGWGTERPRKWWAFQEPSEEYLCTLCEDISVLKKAVRNSTVDVIDGPEGPITDQEEMHDHLTGEWEAKF